MTGTSMLTVAVGWVHPHATLVPGPLLVFALYPVAVTASTRRAVAALVLSAVGISAIRLVTAGEALLAPSVTRRLIEEFARRPQPGQRPSRSLDGITAREREVLELVGQGLS